MSSSLNIYDISFFHVRTIKIDCYRPPTKLQKVMFLHLSVFTFTGECVVLTEGVVLGGVLTFGKSDLLVLVESGLLLWPSGVPLPHTDM